MKHKKYKDSGRVMALLLSVVLMLGLLPLPVRAAGAETGVHVLSTRPDAAFDRLRPRAARVCFVTFALERPLDDQAYLAAL